MIEIEAVDRAAIDMRWRHREGDAADQAAPFRDRVMECEMREGFRDCIGSGFLRRGDCEQQANFVPEFMSQRLQLAHHAVAAVDPNMDVVFAGLKTSAEHFLHAGANLSCMPVSHESSCRMM